jgi:biopolymer transport protein ExbB/TolQ
MTYLPDPLLASYSAADALATSWQFLLKGGVFMIPLGLTSIVGMMAILYKFLSLSRRRVIPDELARKVAELPGTRRRRPHRAGAQGV